MTRQVLVFQPYIPAYRVPLFDRISQLLDENGAHLTVAYGKPSSDEASKGDMERPPYSTPVRSYGIEVGAKRAYWRHLPPDYRADVVVSELDLGNLNAVAGAIGRPIRHARHILWGHGDDFTSRSGWLEQGLETRLAKSADHCMTYSDRGRAALLDRGVPADKVTAIGNAVDNEALRAAYDDATTGSLEEWTRKLRLTNTRNALFVGTFTEPKMIPFLLRSAEEAHRRDPDFQLIMAGSGPLLSLVEKAASDDRGVRFAGRVSPAEVGLLGRLARVMWMPGRVGLVAIDAASLGMPLLTTDAERDAPEIDFLPQRLLQRIPADVDSFVRATQSLMGGDEPLVRPLPPDLPRVADVAGSFVRVVTQVMR